jgi:hypothetical protein
MKKFLFLVMAAILDTGRRWRTQFLNQNVPKFELYKHNVERLRIMGFFMNFELLSILTNYAN